MLNITNRVQHGFTILEMLITITVIAILAWIALPIYESNKLRADFSEVVLAVQGVTRAIEVCANRTNNLNQCHEASDGMVNFAFHAAQSARKVDTLIIDQFPSGLNGNQALGVRGEMILVGRNNQIVSYVTIIEMDPNTGALQIERPAPPRSNCITESLC